jgi:DNA-binding beta-propeller fold protein YncE
MVAVAVATAALTVASAALGANLLYYSNQGAPPGPGISFANLDGSGGSDLSTVGATTDSAVGVAIDAAAGKVYWANANNNTISYANLDGSGSGGQLDTTGATVSVPFGVAIDPVQGRIYWTNFGDDTHPIAYANLDGSGGGDLDITGATASSADGLAVDPGTGKVYWANYGNNTISYANLAGGGGGQLDTSGVTPQGPNGVAIDASSGKLYWSNFGSDTDPISFANLDGSGGGANLSTTGATASGAFGLALDPSAGKVYWANVINNTISYASLAGGGGGQLNVAGSTPNGVGWPALLETPAAAGSPTISGGSAAGSVLTCSQGSWAQDLVESFLYRAPQSFSYSWSENGTPVSGATSSSISATSGGSYTCQVTARNYAGSASQSSAAFTIDASPPSISITTPANGATYAQGQVVAASYSCTDPDGASDVASCSGPVASGAPIDTSTTGSHSFTVNAADKAGNKASKTVTYTVTPPPPHVSLKSKRFNGKAVLVKLACASSGSTCKGKVTLRYTHTVVTVRHGKTHRHKVTVVLGSVKYTLSPGQSKTVRVPLNRAGKRLLEQLHKLATKDIVTLAQLNGHTTTAIRFKITLKPPVTKHHK